VGAHFLQVFDFQLQEVVAAVAGGGDEVVGLADQSGGVQLLPAAKSSIRCWRSPSRSSSAVSTQVSRLSLMRWPAASTMPPSRYQPPRPSAWRNFQSGSAAPRALINPVGPALTGVLAQVSTIAGDSDLQYSVQAWFCFMTFPWSGGFRLGESGLGRFPNFDFRVLGQRR
jgi:hypothetical protein